MFLGYKPFVIQGYDIDKSIMTALYNKSINIYMSNYDKISNDHLALADTTRPTGLKPTDDAYRFQEWDLYAGVQRRTGAKEEYKNTTGIMQNYERTMVKVEEYSKGEVPGEVMMSADAGEFGPLENFIATYTASAGEAHAIAKTETFWDIFNNGTLSAGHSMFNQSLPSGNVTDASGNKIYDSKPLFVKSGGAEHPQSNIVTGTTFYNYTVTLAWSRANYETVRSVLTNTNNRDVFGQRFFNYPTHILANPAMEQYIEPDMRSPELDGDRQVNIRQNEVRRIYSPFISDTDAWFVGDPRKMLLWLENWQPVTIRIWYAEENNVWHIRVSNWYGWCVKDWHPIYGCNQAES